MGEDQNQEDQGTPAGGNTRDVPFPGMGTPIPSAPVVQMPAVNATDRNFDSGGQATAIAAPPQETQPVTPQPPPVAPQQPPSTPDYKLWEGLSKGQLYTKSYDDFKKQFNNPQAIDKLHGQMHDLDLYTKSKEDFYNQFFQHLPPKEVTDAHSFLGDVLNTPAASKAIDKLTADQYYKSIYQQQQAGASGRDATKVQQPIPIRLTADAEADRNDFHAQAAQNPEMLRPVLSEIKRQNVTKSMFGSDKPADPGLNQSINKAAYIADANTRQHSDAVVQHYADQLGSGALEYDIQNKQLVRPENSIASVFRGMKEHSDALNDYDYVTSHNDDDVIKFLDAKNEKIDPDKPVYKSTSTMGSIGNMVGSNLSAGAKLGAGSAAARLAGASAPELALPLAAITTMGMGTGIQDFHHVSYANTLAQIYGEIKQQHPDADPHVALEEAKRQANISGAVAMGQGLIMGEAGSKLAKDADFVPVRYGTNLAKFTKPLGDIVKNSATLIKSIAPDVSTQSLIAGGAKGIENMFQGKPVTDGVGDAMSSTALMMVGLSALHAPDVFLGKEARNNIVDGFAKAPPQVVDNLLGTLVAQDKMTPEVAEVTKQEIVAHKKSSEGVPDFTTPITHEAAQLLTHINDTGAEPNSINKSVLLKIAKDNGIEPEKTAEGKDKELSSTEIIERLQKKQESVKLPKTLEQPEETQARLTFGLKGTYKEMNEQDPEGFLKFVAEQAHGDETNRTELEQAPGVTKSLIDYAIHKYPEHIIAEPKIEPSAEVGQAENTEDAEKPHHTVSPPNIVNIKNKENGTIPIEETGSMGIRDRAAIREEMGGANESVQPAGESGQPEEIQNQNQGQAETRPEGSATKNDVDNPPPVEKNENASDDEGIGISKKAIYDQYGKKFEKTPVGWNEVSKNAVDKLTDEAQRKGTSVAKEAESQVMQMAFEMKTGNLSVSENRITAATLHLMNQDEVIDSLTDRIADNPIDKSALAVDLEIATQNRNATLKVIDAMGSKSGRNLGLFAGMFSKNNDGGITIARRKMEGILGTTIPETLKELEANTTMTASEKNKVRPYVEKLEKIKADYDSEITKAKKSAPKVKEENVATYKDKAKAVADAFRKLKTKPFTFKDENGNEINVTKMGVDWNDIVEAGAKIIEKTGEIADGIAATIEKIKDADWYKNLSDSDKDKFAEQLEAHYAEGAPKIVYTAEEKSVMRLEKKLDELRQGIIKQANEKRVPSEKEKALKDEIFEAKKNAGLVPSKPLQEKPEATMTPAEKNIKRLEKNLEDLQQGIVKQREEKRELTPEEKDLQEKIFEAKKNLGLVGSKGMPKTEQDTELAGLAESSGRKTQQEIKLEAAMKATQRSLEEYERHLSSDTPKSKAEKVSETEELKALREKRDKAKTDYDEMISTGVKPRGHKAGFDVKEDAKDAAIMFQKRKTEGELKALTRLAEDANRKWWDKALDWRRSFLIGGLKTLARVGEAGVAKVTIDPITNLTAGNIASLLPGLRERGVSPKTVKSGLSGLIKFASDKKAMEFVNEKQSAFEKATKELNKNPDDKSVQASYMNAEMENAQAQIYRYIHGNIALDMKELAKFGSTSFDQAMGGYSKVNSADLHGSDKYLYYLNSLTRLHGVEKAPSARRALVEGYNTKLLEYQKEGLPLTASTRMRALDMAYLDFLGGKYQESTQLGDYVNEKKYEGKQPNATLVKKTLSSFLRLAMPVAKIGINLVKQGVDMSTIGTEGVLKYMYETSKGMKLNKAEGLEYKNIFDKLSAGAEKMPEADKRYIHNVLKQGLFGLGLYMYAMSAIKSGTIQYGGEFDSDHLGNARRKYKGEDGKWYDDLDYGQWVIAGHKFGKFGSSVLNHLPQFLPVAMAVNTHNVYKYEHEYKGQDGKRSDADKLAHRFTSGGKRKLKDTEDALWESAKSDVNEITQRLPFTNILEPIRLAKNLLSIPIAKDIGEFFDKDENGNLIERKPKGLLEQGAYNVGLRKFVDKKTDKDKPAAPAPSLPPTQYH